jgi:anti-sigma B factor antagonist
MVQAEIDVPHHEPLSGTIVCRLEGELVASNAAQTRSVMTTLLIHDRVVLDLSGIPFIDSAGLGAVIGGIRRIREHGGRIVLSSCRPGVERLLRTVGLDRIVLLVHDLDEARAALDDRQMDATPVAAGPRATVRN